ncbi:hypothetical protein DPEC_G00305940 [Dallia pectoralis]|uniref:Uncharacterized protein n=1 Tax=Dallia pectoralis TaxID=75939 RepID=A0ACC2FDT9_DALPE|nr:hypothetical protein DPEC_G00305940 [Dallia pectoralis]
MDSVCFASGQTQLVLKNEFLTTLRVTPCARLAGVHGNQPEHGRTRAGQLWDGMSLENQSANTGDQRANQRAQTVTAPSGAVWRDRVHKDPSGFEVLRPVTPFLLRTETEQEMWHGNGDVTPKGWRGDGWRRGGNDSRLTWADAGSRAARRGAGVGVAEVGELPAGARLGSCLLASPRGTNETAGGS